VGIESLAQASNVLIWSAMAVYTVAMCFFAAELAFSPRRRPAPVAPPHPRGDHAFHHQDRGDHAIHHHSARPLVAAGASGGAYGLVSTGSAARSVSPAEQAAQIRAQRRGGSAVALTWLAFALHLASVVTRGLDTGRAPWANMYEFSTASSLVVTAVFLGMLWHRGDVRYLGLFVVGPVLLVLGIAVRVFYIEADQVLPALQSTWIVIHVSAAIIATGIFTVAASQTILFLIQARRERVPATRRGASVMDRFPAAAALDRAAYRMHAFAFPIWTFMVVTGAIWAEDAWGRSWGWDPKEVWAFITWVVYAAYLHARATAGWRGGRAGLVALIGYGTILFNYVVVNIWFSGLHAYGGV
jgi:cytochrome c-type biogenesis protein CcsB